MDHQEKIVSKVYIVKRTIVSMLIFLALMLIAFFSWRALQDKPRTGGVVKPLQHLLSVNESIFKNTFFSANHLSRTYPKSAAASKVRVNGAYGLTSPLDSSWKLEVVKTPGDTLFITLDELKTLPKTEIIFDFKCIEGWSQVTHWGGVKFSDFVSHYGLNVQSGMKYTSLVTPDGQYYVGLDNLSMMHPQTLLCYEMNDAPLPLNQGFPLRLIIPVKYGVKHLKRIGTMSFSNERPKDYWYERGYDYYCGL